MTPKEYKYTKEHEWIGLGASNKARMGITDYAQSQLGDIVFIELPTPGSQVEQSEKIGEIESVKAVSEIFAPVSGKVLEINHAAIDSPQIVNQAPYLEGWLVCLEISNYSELGTLIDSEEYDELIAQLSEQDPD